MKLSKKERKRLKLKKLSYIVRTKNSYPRKTKFGILYRAMLMFIHRRCFRPKFIKAFRTRGWYWLASFYFWTIIFLIFFWYENIYDYGAGTWVSMSDLPLWQRHYSYIDLTKYRLIFYGFYVMFLDILFIIWSWVFVSVADYWVYLFTCLFIHTLIIDLFRRSQFFMLYENNGSRYDGKYTKNFLVPKNKRPAYSLMWSEHRFLENLTYFASYAIAGIHNGFFIGLIILYTFLLKLTYNSLDLFILSSDMMRAMLQWKAVVRRANKEYRKKTGDRSWVLHRRFIKSDYDKLGTPPGFPKLLLTTGVWTLPIDFIWPFGLLFWFIYAADWKWASLARLHRNTDLITLAYWDNWLPFLFCDLILFPEGPFAMRSKYIEKSWNIDKVKKQRLLEEEYFWKKKKKRKGRWAEKNDGNLFHRSDLVLWYDVKRVLLKHRDRVYWEEKLLKYVFRKNYPRVHWRVGRGVIRPYHDHNKVYWFNLRYKGRRLINNDLASSPKPKVLKFGGSEYKQHYLSKYAWQVKELILDHITSRVKFKIFNKSNTKIQYDWWTSKKWGDYSKFIKTKIMLFKNNLIWGNSIAKQEWRVNVHRGTSFKGSGKIFSEDAFFARRLFHKIKPVPSHLVADYQSWYNYYKKMYEQPRKWLKWVKINWTKYQHGVSFRKAAKYLYEEHKIQKGAALAELMRKEDFENYERQRRRQAWAKQAKFKK